MLDPTDKAQILIEALPYIQRFAGKTFVIKYGGHAMTEPALKASFAADVVLLKCIGMQPVIIHGGGPQIGHILERLGIQSTFVGGLRVGRLGTIGVMHALTAPIAALLRPAPTVASAAVMLTVAGVTLAVLSATAATLPAARLPAGRGRRQNNRART